MIHLGRLLSTADVAQVTHFSGVRPKFQSDRPSGRYTYHQQLSFLAMSAAANAFKPLRGSRHRRNTRRHSQNGEKLGPGRSNTSLRGPWWACLLASGNVLCMAGLIFARQNLYVPGKTLEIALLGNFVCLTFDFVARHKVDGTHLNYFIYKQLPVLTSDSYASADLAFIVPRVLELTRTAHDMQAWADDLLAALPSADPRPPEEQGTPLPPLPLEPLAPRPAARPARRVLCAPCTA